MLCALKKLPSYGSITFVRGAFHAPEMRREPAFTIGDNVMLLPATIAFYAGPFVLTLVWDPRVEQSTDDSEEI